MDLTEPILMHERITADGAEPERWLFVLHGIYGAGRNWKSVAQRAVAARGDWGCVLVDLRQHGGSQGFSPPHTVERAAGDLDRLARELGAPVSGVLGHSFGGKVALMYGRGFDEGLEQIWVVDSTPEPRPPSGQAWDMLKILRRVPDTFESRSAAVGALEAEGVATPIARWISTNLERVDDGYRWRIELDAMEALLRDFFRTDLWDVVEAPPAGVELHVVKAERSTVLSEGACARIEAAGRRTGRVHLHRVAGGHWLNADNPDALEQLLREHL